MKKQPQTSEVYVPPAMLHLGAVYGALHTLRDSGWVLEELKYEHFEGYPPQVTPVLRYEPFDPSKDIL